MLQHRFFFTLFFLLGIIRLFFFWVFFFSGGLVWFFFLVLISSELFFINDQCLTYLEEHLEKNSKIFLYRINSTKLSRCFVNDSIHLIFNGIVVQVSDVVPGPLGLCFIYNRGSIRAHCLVAILIISTRIFKHFFQFSTFYVFIL